MQAEDEQPRQLIGYPLVNVCTLLLKMALETVDLPNYKLVNGLRNS